MSRKKLIERGAVRDLIDADIHDGCARLHKIARHHPAGRWRRPECRHGGRRRAGRAFWSGNGDGGVGIEEEHSHRLADDVAATDDDGFLSSDRNVAALQNFMHRRACRVRGRGAAWKDSRRSWDEIRPHLRGIDSEQNFFSRSRAGAEVVAPECRQYRPGH